MTHSLWCYNCYILRYTGSISARQYNIPVKVTILVIHSKMSRTTLVQDIADQVTCGICLEHFKIPKTVMPCLHNFCECCLQDMIESTSHPTGRASPDLTVYATFSLPCPSCRGAVEFPVRIPQPWNMKRIAQEAAKKEFKTNYQIKNQLDIIKTKIKQGCQEHQGEIKMWFCKACKAKICQFCVLQDHNSSEHEITPLNFEQKKQGLKHSKDQVQKQVAELESSCADMEGQLADIHKTRGRFEDQKKLIMDEFVAVHIKLETLESQINSKQKNFIQQLTSRETKILQVYQEASEDVEHYKTKVDELDRKLDDADFEIVSLSDKTETEPFLKPNFIPVVEIPKRPEISLDLLQNGMLEIKETLENISRDLELSDIVIEPGSAPESDVAGNGRVIQRSEQLIFRRPLTARMLAQVSHDEQKQMIGERFYPIICQMHGDLAGKITGMLLEMDNAQLLHMLESSDALHSNVEEAVAALQAYQSKLTNIPSGNERALTPVEMQTPQTHQHHPQQLYPQELYPQHPYQPNPLMPVTAAPSFIHGPPPGLLPPTSLYMGHPKPTLPVYDSRQQPQPVPSGLIQQPYNMAPIYQPFARPPDASHPNASHLPVYDGRAQKKQECPQELTQSSAVTNPYECVIVNIKNLDEEIDDDKLMTEFNRFGTITSAKVMSDERGTSKGFGFVCYASPEEATKAVTEMNRRILGAKRLYVGLAKRNEKRKILLAMQRVTNVPASFSALPSFYQQQPIVSFPSTSANYSPTKATIAQQLPPPTRSLPVSTHSTQSTLTSEQPNTADITNSASNSRYPWEEPSTGDVAQSVSISQFPWEESNTASATDSSSRSDSTEASVGLNESGASSTDVTPTFSSFSSAPPSPLRVTPQQPIIPSTQPPQSLSPIHDWVEAGWRRFWSKREGLEYFFNTFSKQSSWTMPTMGNPSGPSRDFYD